MSPEAAEPPDSPEARERAKDIVRRRDALLAEARGDTKRDEDAGSAARLGGLGVQFAVALVLFLSIGSWLDKRYLSSPWGMLAGLIIGFGSGGYLLVRAVRDENRREAEAKARKGK